MESLDSIVALVNNLNSESTVVVSYHSRYYRYAEPLDILLDRISRNGISEHDIFGIGICHIAFLAGGKSSHRKERHCNIFQNLLHISLSVAFIRLNLRTRS